MVRWNKMGKSQYFEIMKNVDFARDLEIMRRIISEKSVFFRKKVW